MKHTLMKWLKGAGPAEAGRDVRALQPFPEDSEPPSQVEPESIGNSTSGQTIFSAEALDPALRFRSLTVSEADTAALENDSGPPAFKIRLAKGNGFKRDAGGLIDRRYSDRGYLIPQSTQDPNLFTFLAYDEGKIVGTVSIRIDSPKGLSADALYADELDDMRRNDCTLCEFTRLAVDVKSASKPVLAGLFHTAYLYATKLRGTKFGVIEVNPRHVPFYRRSLGFEPLGPERMNTVVNAPAVLMCLSFDVGMRKVEEFGGKPELAATNRMLYPHFFSPQDEAGILERLRDLDAASHSR